MLLKRNFQRLKYIKIISLSVLMSYGLHPFVNGLGCDYHSQADTKKISFYTTCKLGIIETIAKNKTTGKIASFKGIYGKSGSTIFFITLKSDILSFGDSNIGDAADLHDSKGIYISTVVKNNEGNDWILLQHPYYTIHKSNRIGRLSLL